MRKISVMICRMISSIFFSVIVVLLAFTFVFLLLWINGIVPRTWGLRFPIITLLIVSSLLVILLYSFNKTDAKNIIKLRFSKDFMTFFLGVNIIASIFAISVFVVTVIVDYFISNINIVIGIFVVAFIGISGWIGYYSISCKEMIKNVIIVHGFAMSIIMILVSVLLFPNIFYKNVGVINPKLDETDRIASLICAKAARLVYDIPKDHGDAKADDRSGNLYSGDAILHEKVNKQYGKDWEIADIVYQPVSRDMHNTEKSDIQFSAILLANKNENKLIIAIAGTDSWQKIVFEDGVRLGLIGIPNEAINSLMLYKTVLDYCNEYNVKPQIYVTGHSLGGYLAQVLVYQIIKSDNDIRNNIKSVELFNSVKINWNLNQCLEVKRHPDSFYGKMYSTLDSLDDKSIKLVSNEISGDQVSLIGQTVAGIRRIYIAPQKRGSTFIDLHNMDLFINLLEKDHS